MDDRARAYIALLGNPYAVLSVLDEAELDATPAPSLAQPTEATVTDKPAHLVQTHLFGAYFRGDVLNQPSGNPYAQLSNEGNDETDVHVGEAEPHVLWKSRSEVYDFVEHAFTLPLVRKRPPPLLRQFATTALRLSEQAQVQLRARIESYLPEHPVVYNRLSPRELDVLLEKLIGFAKEAAGLDGKTD